MSFKIFQTYKSKDPSTWPLTYIKCQESWQRLHPNIPYRIYDDAAVEEICLKLIPRWAWNMLIKGVEKADVFRYCQLFLDGGLYVDMDFMALKEHESLVKLFSEGVDGPKIVFGKLQMHPGGDKWKFMNSIPNAWMLSIYKGEIFWLVVLQTMLNNLRDSITEIEVKTEVKTGPILLFNSISKYLEFTSETDAYAFIIDFQQFVPTAFSKIHILPPQLIYPCSWLVDTLSERRLFFNQHNWEEIMKQYPDSIAFTPWAHNW